MSLKNYSFGSLEIGSVLDSLDIDSVLGSLGIDFVDVLGKVLVDDLGRGLAR